MLRAISQAQHPHLPIFGAVTNGCFCLLPRQGIVFQRRGSFAFVRDFGSCRSAAFRTKPAAEGGCFKGHCCL